MTSLTLLVCLVAPQEADKTDRDTLIKNARTIVAAVVEAARDNQRQPRPAKGDALTSLYVRAAARAAAKLPEKQAGPAFALAVGVALDTSALMRSNPAVASTWKRVESDMERKARLAVVGKPTMYDRHDLAQHFAVSMALVALLGEKKAESAGILKELLDAGEGGSGFSFADLAADLSGIAFARQVIARPARLAGIAKRFAVSDYTLSPKGLPEGLSLAEFEKRYGGIRDARFTKSRDDLVRRIGELPGYQP
jgi:hypothetical protein